MLGPMALLAQFDVSRYTSLILVQFLGACIFWFIDKWIFDEET